MSERPHVAIVDDDADTRTMLSLAFESAGFAVTEIVSGIRLVASLHVDRPDLIVVEPGTHWIDGLSLCRSLGDNPRTCDLPVVFLSERRRPEDVTRGYEAGVVDYFTKPVHVEALVHRAREILEGQREPEP